MSKDGRTPVALQEMKFRPRTKARGRASIVRAACLYFIEVWLNRLAPGGIGVAQGRMDDIRVQEYTLFGSGEVQRWNKIHPCQQLLSNLAEKMVICMSDDIFCGCEAHPNFLNEDNDKDNAYFV